MRLTLEGYRLRHSLCQIGERSVQLSFVADSEYPMCRRLGIDVNLGLDGPTSCVCQRLMDEHRWKNDEKQGKNDENLLKTHENLLKTHEHL